MFCTDAQMVLGRPYRGLLAMRSNSPFLLMGISTEREGRAAGSGSPGVGFGHLESFSLLQPGEMHQTHHGRAVRARNARLERRDAGKMNSRWETIGKN